jgi:5-methylcytosine-specific restriction endonuclease McrA
MSYQKKFVYNVFKNVKDIDERPLYDVNSVVYKQNQMDGLRFNLGMRQGWRCLHCQNPILQKDIYDYKIHYIKPLQFGGENNINNLGIKCKICSEFSPY